ncbi:NUDIX hydrolase [Halalkalibacter kiskunsagensis]|uniref:NUDIX hydrolase n=1 Tax=Halalkalibacter kiskunsagensis TaxID=1548599 RepID=A0ABV6KJZ1_9BACI
MNDLMHIQQQLTNRTSNILGSTSMKSAVIVPLIYVDNELSILFEVRSKQLNKQPGEICFPGGKIDPTDSSPEAAAIRELSEEVGIHEKNIDVIASLDILVTPFRGIIYPFVGVLSNLNDVSINHHEVDHTFTVPVSYLYNYEPKRHTMKMWFEPSDDFPIKVIANKENYSKRYHEIQEYFYYYHNYVIWGLTARILTHFIELTKPR